MNSRATCSWKESFIIPDSISSRVRRRKAHSSNEKKRFPLKKLHSHSLRAYIHVIWKKLSLENGLWQFFCLAGINPKDAHCVARVKAAGPTFLEQSSAILGFSQKGWGGWGSKAFSFFLLGWLFNRDTRVHPRLMRDYDFKFFAGEC